MSSSSDGSARPLLSLVVGIALAVVITVAISPGRSFTEVLGPVLITTALGGLVLAVVARRARLRDAQERLRAREELRDAGIELSENNGSSTTPTDTPSDDQEPDRG